jgi:SAM-dependent methyltransferase
VSVFAALAGHYDSLYEDKNYEAEADYVHALIQRYQPGARSIVDLGCGTGRHAIAFAEKGYAVLGVDRSPDMLSEAKTRLETIAPELNRSINFCQADIRDFSVAKSFDAVVALFHVMSYQTSNGDVAAALSSARSGLRAGGIFIFDCWYGPGVLTDPPATRVKRVSRDRRRVVRIAEPTMHGDHNTVDVNYQFFIENEGSGYAEFRETHTMRYFFIPELELLLRQTGWQPLSFLEWMTDRPPVNDTWSLTVVAQSSAG